MGNMNRKELKLRSTGKYASACGSDLRVHFKNTREAAKALKGKTILNARKYLQDVISHKRCVVFSRFNGCIGRTAQAKLEGSPNARARWPKKSCESILSLINNAESNAKFRGLNVNKLYIRHILVNKAMRSLRRSYRYSFGGRFPRANNPCHIEIILEEWEELTNFIVNNVLINQEKRRFTHKKTLMTFRDKNKINSLKSLLKY